MPAAATNIPRLPCAGEPICSPEGASTTRPVLSRILTLQLLALLLVAVISCAAHAGITTRVSVASDGPVPWSVKFSR